MSSKTSNSVIALLAGAVIGVGLGILFAPDKGSKTREKMKEGFDDLKDQANSKWNSLEEETKEKFSKTKDDLIETVEDLLLNSSYKAEEAITFLEDKLAELKKQNAKRKTSEIMAFEELKENTEAIQENAKAFIETNIAYYKLWGFKVAMKSTTLILKFFLIAMCLMIVLLFISIAGAMAFGQLFDSYPLGFLAVAGIYLVLALLLFLVKDKIVEGPILEKFSEIFFKD